MSFLGRVFMSAVVRKLGYAVGGVLIALAVAFVGMGEARAGTDLHATSSLASAHCNEVVAGNVAALCATMVDRAPGAAYCIAQQSNKRFQEQGQCIDSNPSNGTSSPYTFSAAQLNFHTWTTNDCPSRAEVYNWFYDPAVADGKVCDNGCTYQGGVNIEDGSTSHIPTGDTCGGVAGTDPPAPSTDPDDDGDGVPNQDDDFPDDPTESTDSDGDGVGDNGDSAPDDPTNGGDTPGDEDGDDEGDNVSSGGGSCSAPPVSSGDGLLTQIAFQAWKTRCAIEAVTDGGAVKTKVTNWPASASTGTGGGDDPLNMDGFDPAATGNTTEGGAHPDTDGIFESADLASQISAGPDAEGWLSVRSCPLLDLPPALELSFGSATMPWPGICTALAIIGQMVLLAGYIQWAFIVARAGSNG